MTREKGASGEKVIWCPRGMNGEGVGRGVEPCLTNAFVRNVRGSYSSTLAYRLLGLGLCTEGRG